jgi:hypothetical protein
MNHQSAASTRLHTSVGNQRNMIEVKAKHPLPYQQEDGVRRPELRTERLQVRKLLRYLPNEQLQQFLLQWGR